MFVHVELIAATIECLGKYVIMVKSGDITGHQLFQICAFQSVY